MKRKREREGDEDEAGAELSVCLTLQVQVATHTHTHIAWHSCACVICLGGCTILIPNLRQILWYQLKKWRNSFHFCCFFNCCLHFEAFCSFLFCFCCSYILDIYSDCLLEATLQCQQRATVQRYTIFSISHICYVQLPSIQCVQYGTSYVYIYFIYFIVYEKTHLCKSKHNYLDERERERDSEG